MTPAIADRNHTLLLQREAARLLAAMVASLHVLALEPRGAHIEMKVPLGIFDRLCIWGAAAEDLEDDDPAEDGGDAEAEDAA